jgi:hypothetical protein
VLGKGASGAEAARLGFDHWHLDRKLRELYRSQGVSEDEARRATDLMRAVLARTVPEVLEPYGAGKTPGLLAAALIEEHYQAEDFRRILGINFFEDVTWFNKEGFEDALFYGALFLTLENEAAFEEPGKKAKTKAGPKAAAGTKAASLHWRDRVKIIAELSAALNIAEAASGYRLDGLLDSLAGQTEENPAAQQPRPEG